MSQIELRPHPTPQVENLGLHTNQDASSQHAELRVSNNDNDIQPGVFNSPEENPSAPTLGFYSAFSVFVGLVVGSGIYSSPGPVYQQTGTFYGSTIVWLLSGALALFGTMCYAELGAAYPKCGAEHVYYYKLFGSLPSFLFSFTGWITRPVSVSVIALSLAEYIFSAVLGKTEADKYMWSIVFLSIAIIIINAAISSISEFSSNLIQNVLLVVKMLLLSFLIISGMYTLAKNGGQLADAVSNVKSTYGDSFKTGNVGKLSKSFYLALWSYDGWSNLNLIAGNIKNPGKNIPFALLLGISIIIALYVLISTSYFAVLNTDELTGINSITVFADNLFGKIGVAIITFAVCLSSYGGLNSSFYCNNEVFIAAANDNFAPKFISKCNKRFGTPINSNIVQSIIAIIVSLIFKRNYDSLVVMYSVCFWVFYALSAFAVHYSRRKDKITPRPYRALIVAPSIFVFSTVFMIIFSFIESMYECIASVVIFAIGCLVWYIFIYKSKRFVFTGDSKIPSFVTVPGIYNIKPI